jgi:hypothetical protein
MASRVLLSVDTELTRGNHVPGEDWRANFERSYDPAGVGIPWQLERLAAHGLKACFFVDPMPALVHGIAPVRAMVEPILAAGQEVQLHLHSWWWDAAAGRDEADWRYELTAFAPEEQFALIRTARDLLVEAGAPPPIAFRSGSYAADAATLKALARLGIAFDSSHNGSHHPWPSALPLDPRLIAPVRAGGITEIPVTQIEHKPGQLRHLQLCAVSGREMAEALGHAAAASHPLVTIVSHSFELATRDGRRRNGLVAGRFERLCRFLAAARAALPTVHIADLAAGGLALDEVAAPLPPVRARTARRVAEQLWADMRYERPSVAATAFGGSAASGLEIIAPLVLL